MNTSPAEQANPEAHLMLPDHVDFISEANWPEMKAKGYHMLIEQFDPATEEGQRGLKVWIDTYGPEYVYTGSAFEWDERRPLDHKPGRGIYSGPEAEQVLQREGHYYERQASPGTGPASS